MSVVRKRPTKLNVMDNRWKHYSFRSRLSIVLATIACCGTAVQCAAVNARAAGHAVDHETIAAAGTNGTDYYCSVHRTCTGCVAAAACGWSLAEQRCRDRVRANATVTTPPTTDAAATTEAAASPSTRMTTPEPSSATTVGPADDPSPPLVHGARSCPAYSVNYTKKTDIGSVTHTVVLDVSNDPGGAFGALLRRGPVGCELLDVSFPAAVALSDRGARVACEIRENTTEYDAESRGRRPSVVYFAVTVGGVPLEFDNLTDHYTTVYHNSCDAGRPAATGCVSCVWEDEEKRRYYCRWCPRSNACTGPYQHCDVRKPRPSGGGGGGDLSYVPDRGVENVRVRCPAIRIDSFEPVYGPWAGGTTVRIAVANHRTIAEGKLMKVTVAGNRCLLPTASADGATVQCVISAINSSRQLAEGPVEVTYVQSGDDRTVPALTLRSDQTFYFVDPEITDVRPRCGNVTGGTEVTIRGNFLNAGNRLKVFVRENVSCEITAHGHNDVTCVTAAADAPGAGRVKLEFDHYLAKYVPYPLFEYTTDPRLDGGQTFSGIASGGTRLPVRGRHFSCIQNPLMFVIYNAMRHTGACEVRNDTYMVCTTPSLNRPTPRSVTKLRYGFQADFDRHIVTLNSTDDHYYVLYPDPVYTYFDADDGDGRTVTINGQHLDRGFQLADDLSVRFRDSGAACNVSSVQPRRIVCRVFARPAPQRHDAIEVSVGSNLLYDVQRRFSGRSHSMLLTVVFGGITVVSLIVTLVVAVVYCTKIALMASSMKHPTEMQSLCEQLQSTATVAGPQQTEPLPTDRNDEEQKNTPAAFGGYDNSSIAE